MGKITLSEAIHSMSIQLINEVRELRDRVETLERKMNRMGTEPRTVAGVPDPEPVSSPPRRGRPRKEGTEV